MKPQETQPFVLLPKETIWLSWREFIGLALYSTNFQPFAAYDFSCVIAGYTFYEDKYFSCESVWRILTSENVGKSCT
jgi:hypothetical protein